MRPSRRSDVFRLIHELTPTRAIHNQPRARSRLQHLTENNDQTSTLFLEPPTAKKVGDEVRACCSKGSFSKKRPIAARDSRRSIIYPGLLDPFVSSALLE